MASNEQKVVYHLFKISARKPINSAKVEGYRFFPDKDTARKTAASKLYDKSVENISYYESKEIHAEGLAFCFEIFVDPAISDKIYKTESEARKAIPASANVLFDNTDSKKQELKQEEKNVKQEEKIKFDKLITELLKTYDETKKDPSQRNMSSIVGHFWQDIDILKCKNSLSKCKDKHEIEQWFDNVTEMGLKSTLLKSKIEETLKMYYQLESPKQGQITKKAGQRM